MRTILFVCTGNTCRSPMAEAIARHLLDSGAVGVGGDVFVASAGLMAGEGAPPTPETLQTLNELGIEHSGRSKRLTAPMISKADAVFVMTAGHQETARALVSDSPLDMEKIQLLNPAEDVDDPIGMGQDAYDALGRSLLELLPRRIRDVLESEPSPTAGG